MATLNLAEVRQVLFLGDTHGSFQVFEKAVRQARKYQTNVIVQLGDFGYWVHVDPGKSFITYLNVLLEREDMWVLWIRGNHENTEELFKHFEEPYPDELIQISSRIWHVPDGMFFSIGDTSFLACGGSVSVDKAHRVEGLSWWRDETISYRQVTECTRPEVVDSVVDVVLSHDAPDLVPLRTLLGGSGLHLSEQLDAEAAGQRALLSAVVGATNPEFVFHGHYHHYHDTTVDNGGESLRVVGLAHEQSNHNMGLFDTSDRVYTKI